MYHDLTKGNISRSLLLFALPMMAGNLLQQFYNIADTLIVGRVLGRDALAAVGSAYTLITFLTSIFLGLSLGSGALFSIYKGRGDEKTLKSSVFHAFVLIMAVTVVLNILVYLGLDGILAFLKVPEEVWQGMRQYLLIIFAGLIATSLYNFFACLLRAMGNSTVPLVFLAVSTVINIVLDLLFVAVWSMGIGGAALATIIREFMLENTGQLMEKLENWCEENKVTLEIQVNDWAMAEMLKGKVLFVPVLGILLNKRRKDPRLHYKTETMAQIGAETESKFLEENSLNADFYRKYLEKEYGIVRYEWESCGYDMALPPGKNSLHLPFYQTNTSQYCTLYAKCMTGERGKQKLAEECPKFCKDYAFLYPDHLMMIGRYNSLFALDSRIFEDGSGSGTGTEIGTKIKTEEILKKWKKAGVDRLVVNLLDPGVKR